jgi:hypothetical protein
MVRYFAGRNEQRQVKKLNLEIAIGTLPGKGARLSDQVYNPRIAGSLAKSSVLTHRKRRPKRQRSTLAA